jgi:peptidyl-prolyl cis-trans isomerase D
MDAIFSAPLNGSPEMDAAPQGQVVFQVTDVKPPATPTFDEIRARVESEFKADRAQQLMGQKLQELADKARSSHDLKKAAQAVGASFRTSELVGPQSQVPELGRMADGASVAFTMNKGDISNPVQTQRGGAVLMLTDRQEPTADELAKGSQQTRDSLLNAKRDQAFQVFAAGLRQRMEKDGKIRVNKDEMNRLMSRSNEAGE